MTRMILTSGRSAGGSVKSMGSAADIVSCCDSFVTGPLVAADDLEGLAAARWTYWETIPVASPWFGSEPEWSIWDAIYPSMDERLARAEQFEAWVGDDLGDIMFSVFAPLFLVEHGIRTDQISIRRFRSERRFGLGVLNTQELSTPPNGEVVTAPEIERLTALWDIMFAISVGGEVPSAGDVSDAEAWALDILRGRWPDEVTGLTNIQKCLLREAPRERKKAAYFVGHAICCADGDGVGDHVLFDELKKMGDPAFGEPMFEIFGVGDEMRRTEAVLTPAGRKRQAELE